MNRTFTNRSVCFILDHDLKQYRLPFFEQMVSQLDIKVTVMHSGKALCGELNVEEVIVKKVILGPLTYRRLPALKSFDFVVCMQNIRLLNLWTLSLNPLRSFKLLQWGIGVSSSKGLHLKRSSMSIVRNGLARFCEAIVLYSDFALPLFSEQNRTKTFVAPNTVHTPLSEDLSTAEKTHFLFIGSLDRRKGLPELITYFGQYLNSSNAKRIRKLLIVGDGEMKAELHNLIESLELSESIIMMGRISGDMAKKELFKGAVCSLSLYQAGLSVLESFSYGVPYVTYKSAISGGEHLNIAHNHNGFLIADAAELVSLMRKMDEQNAFTQQLGHNAYNHYQKRRKISDMVAGFEKAFVYTLERQGMKQNTNE